MRKVGVTGTEADAHLESKIAAYTAELERCVQSFQSVAESQGTSAALQTLEAERIAQYEKVVKVLTNQQVNPPFGDVIRVAVDNDSN